MRVFVAGATGRVGRHLVADLVDAGHEVIAASRHPEALEGDNVRAVPFDFHASAKEMAPLLGDAQAICFVAGSRGKDLLQVDAFGAVKLMQAAESRGIRRFVMLSSLFSMEPDRWAEEKSLADITDYNIAKLFADEWLINDTDLDYTIVQASILVEKPATGRITTAPEHDGENPIADVAQVLADVLEMPNTYKKVIPMCSGNTPIEDALSAL